MADLGNLDDEDYPAYTTGQAARMLGVQEAFLRSLDTADVVRPQRSEGGHRRYSRRQLTLVARPREQLDEGHALAAAARIVGLQDQLIDAENTITDLRANSTNAPPARAWPTALARPSRPTGPSTPYPGRPSTVPVDH